MGLYPIAVCNKSHKRKFEYLYIFLVVALIIISVLLETNTIPRTQFEKDSIWWYGCIGVLIIAILVVIGSVLQMLLKKIGIVLDDYNFWNISHFFAYMSLTLVSPGQWPIWLAIGTIWEFTECYTLCWPKNTLSCSGYYDILANFAGIAFAMWILNARENHKSTQYSESDS